MMRFPQAVPARLDTRERNLHMRFSSDINRPPYEAMDGFLQVTSGCTHNSCAFCTLYKNAPFKMSPLEEVEEDLKELRDSGWRFQRLFLQGADAFVLPYDRLMKIAEMVYEYLPFVESIGGYARVTNVKNKTVEQLISLKAAGYGGFFFGLETGDDYLLKRMRKGYESKDIVEQMSKLDEAGMPWVSSFIGGLGGKDYGLSHARETARVLNQLKPALIYPGQLTIFPDTPLSKDIREGTFQEATEIERLQEMQEFIRCLDIDTVFVAEHVSVAVPVRGRLPQQKDEMIAILQNQIENAEEKRLRYYRERIRNL